MNSHVSIKEFSEQGGTNHLAPQERVGGAGTHHCGKLLGETINACKMAWESVTHFIRLGAAGGRDVKSSFSARQLICGTAFKVAQHSNSSCSIGKVPKNPVIPLNTLLEKMHAGTKSSQEALILFQSGTPWATLPLPGEPWPDCPFV